MTVADQRLHQQQMRDGPGDVRRHVVNRRK